MVGAFSDALLYSAINFDKEKRKAFLAGSVAGCKAATH
jgi:hypothetical protein